MFSFNLHENIAITIDGLEIYPVKLSTNIIIPERNWTVKPQDILTVVFRTGVKSTAVNIGAEVYKIAVTEGLRHIAYPNKKFFTHTTKEWATESTFFKIGNNHIYATLESPSLSKDGLIIGFICRAEDIYFPDTHADSRNNKKINRTVRIISESNPALSYEVLAYEDGTYSCNCPGWTKRVDKQGYRTCKHVKKVKTS